MTPHPFGGEATCSAAPKRWAPGHLDRLDLAEELEIATRRPDGTLRPWVPIWVVCVDGQAYVRTWHRRSTGWFGSAVAAGTARIRVPGVDTDVDIDDVATANITLRRQVDDAYRAKYHRYGITAVENMTNKDACAATLRLLPSGA